MRRLRKRQYHAEADINITNLVDVVLVLLIIFMISAPLLQSGIEVNLPKTRAADISEEAEGIVITIDNKGGIYINDKWTRLDGFEGDLRTAMTTKNTSAVYIRGDSAVYYYTAIDVISRIKKMGVEEIGLVTARKEDNKTSDSKR